MDLRKGSIQSPLFDYTPDRLKLCGIIYDSSSGRNSFLTFQSYRLANYSFKITSVFRIYADGISCVMSCTTFSAKRPMPKPFMYVLKIKTLSHRQSTFLHF